MLINGLHHEICQLDSALATLGKRIVDCKSTSHLLAMLTQDLNLLVGIGSKLVEGNHHGLSEALQVLHVLVEVPIAILHALDVWLLDVFLSHATVHLQGLQGNNQDSEVWLQTSLAALDVIELLCAQVGTESSLRDSIVAIFKSCRRSHHRITSVGDVGEWTAMYESRSSLCRLHEVWLEGIQEQSHDAAAHSHILHGEWFVILCDAEQDVVDATAKVFETRGEAHDSHNL